jgi:hypothetical protein
MSRWEIVAEIGSAKKHQNTDALCLFHVTAACLSAGTGVAIPPAGGVIEAIGPKTSTVSEHGPVSPGLTTRVPHGTRKFWQGWKESNLRMPESKSGALTNLATPLHRSIAEILQPTL